MALTSQKKLSKSPTSCRYSSDLRDFFLFNVLGELLGDESTPVEDGDTTGVAGSTAPAPIGEMVLEPALGSGARVSYHVVP